MNVVVLSGRLSRPAEHRELPSGDQLLGLEVTIVREGERSERAGRVARSARPRRGLDTDDEVVVVGRVRRRFFRSGATRRAAPRSWPTTCCALDRRQVRAAVDRAARDLEDLLTPADGLARQPLSRPPLSRPPLSRQGSPCRGSTSPFAPRS